VPSLCSCLRSSVPSSISCRPPTLVAALPLSECFLFGSLVLVSHPRPPPTAALLLTSSSLVHDTRGKRDRGEGLVGARVSAGAGAATDAYKRIEVCKLLSFGDTLATLLDTSKNGDPWSFLSELVMNLQGESGEFRIWIRGKRSLT
jgi:hypothetical protein